jgi:hypothetical protein
MVKRYVFDRKSGRFTRVHVRLGDVLLAILKYTVAIFLSAVAFYVVFALAFSTERERNLEQENRLLAVSQAAFSERLDLVEGTVGNLRLRDREIYRDLFGANPPSYIVEARDSLLVSGDDLEEMAEPELVWDAYAAINRMESAASQVSRYLTEIDTLLSGGSMVPTSVPSILPLEPFSPVQTGASVGKKINPFYKTIREHSGLDLLAPSGTPVRCTAEGKVAHVVRNEKGMGNLVIVEHKGGFRTLYAHLDGIRVSQGQTLRQGQQIGTVGQSGSCFAPCLHYEVLRDGFLQDPVNYFFAQLSPQVYHEMMVVALTTGQSMD